MLHIKQKSNQNEQNVLKCDHIILIYNYIRKWNKKYSDFVTNILEL